jgi:GNAT superfamily N-acetyltransferase
MIRPTTYLTSRQTKHSTMPTCIPIDHTTDYEQWHALWKAYLEFYNTELPEEQYRDTFSRLVDPDGDLGGFVLVLANEEAEDGDGDETKGEDRDNDEQTLKTTKYKYIGLAHYLTHTSAWSPAHTRHCYLNDLYVDPAVRGTGGGRMLIEAVQEEAKAKLGCSRVYWLTAPDNVAARRLYDKVAVTNRVAYKIDL